MVIGPFTLFGTFTWLLEGKETKVVLQQAATETQTIVQQNANEARVIMQQAINNVEEVERSSPTGLLPLRSRSLLLVSLTGKLTRQDLRKWLSPPDPSTNHNIAHRAQHEGTAMWFFECEIYKKWKSNSSLLWVHGKRTYYVLTLRSSGSHRLLPFVAGSGKSVLW
jgi:hypothetical protein